MNLRILIAATAAFASGFAPAPAGAAPAAVERASAGGILSEFPDLGGFVARERPSHLFFGFGLNPMSIVGSKVGVSASLFQVHWIKGALDLEALNVAVGTVFGQQYGSEQNFVVRVAPKFRFLNLFSIGPVGGAEFVHFPEVTYEVNKANRYSKPYAFSNVGFIYGITLSETIPIGAPSENKQLKIGQTYYRETYSVTDAGSGWSYYYLQNPLNADPSAIAPSGVFLLEISFLY